RFQQSSVQNRLTLVRKSLRYLLAHTRALKSQVLVGESLLLEFEDVPLAAELHWLRVITNLHRPEKTCNQIGREVVALQILLGRKTDIAAGSQAVDVFALGASDSREVSLALELLVDIVNLQLRIGVVLRVVSDSLSAVVSGVNHDH